MENQWGSEVWSLLREGFAYLYAGGEPVAVTLLVTALGLVGLGFGLLFLIRRVRRRWSDAVEWHVARVDRDNVSQTVLINSKDLGNRFPDNTHALSIVAPDENGRPTKLAAKVGKVRAQRIPQSDGGPLQVRISDDLLEKLGVLDDFDDQEFKPLKVRVRSRVAPWNSPDRGIYISFWTTLWVTVFTTIIAIFLELFVPSVVD